MSESPQPAGERLNVLLAAAGFELLSPRQRCQFEDFLSLILRWNSRISLTAVRDEESILSRHFLESISCARALPDGVVTLLDFGSGAGLPGIPIALCRPEISVTLAESNGRKAAFLEEAIRVLGIPARVYVQRAETLSAVFDCVVLRAVDRMPKAVKAATRLIRPGGWLGVMTTRVELAGLKTAAGAECFWGEPFWLPSGEDRLFALSSWQPSRC